MKTAICILYILVLFLAGWLSYACYCNLQFDANNTAGVVVSALGILVSVLVGWQIFNIIELKQQVEAVKKAKETIFIEAEISAMQTYMGLSEYYGKENNLRPINEDPFYRYIYFNISVILHAARIDDHKTCGCYINALLETVTENATLLRPKDKNDLMRLLTFIPNNHKIYKFNELFQRINNIKIKE